MLQRLPILAIRSDSVDYSIKKAEKQNLRNKTTGEDFVNHVTNSTVMSPMKVRFIRWGSLH